MAYIVTCCDTLNNNQTFCPETGPDSYIINIYADASPAAGGDGDEGSGDWPGHPGQQQDGTTPGIGVYAWDISMWDNDNENWVLMTSVTHNSNTGPDLVGNIDIAPYIFFPDGECCKCKARVKVNETGGDGDVAIILKDPDDNTLVDAFYPSSPGTQHAEEVEFEVSCSYGQNSSAP